MDFMLFVILCAAIILFVIANVESTAVSEEFDRKRRHRVTRQLVREYRMYKLKDSSRK